MSLVRSKSVAFTSKVSTKIVRAWTDGSDTYCWSYQPVIVPSIPLARETVPVTGLTVFVRGRADSLMPKVGHRGGWPFSRSKMATGKFDSIPPSTSHDLDLSVPSMVAGR